MSVLFYYTDPPEYHSLEIGHDLAEKLVEAGFDNQHFFINRDAVEELLNDPTVPDDERGKLQKWLSARPDDDELYFSYSV